MTIFTKISTTGGLANAESVLVAGRSSLCRFTGLDLSCGRGKRKTKYNPLGTRVASIESARRWLTKF